MESLDIQVQVLVRDPKVLRERVLQAPSHQRAARVKEVKVLHHPARVKDLKAPSLLLHHLVRVKEVKAPSLLTVAVKGKEVNPVGKEANQKVPSQERVELAQRIANPLFEDQIVLTMNNLQPVKVSSLISLKMFLVQEILMTTQHNKRHLLGYFKMQKLMDVT